MLLSTSWNSDPLSYFGVVSAVSTQNSTLLFVWGLGAVSSLMSHYAGNTGKKWLLGNAVQNTKAMTGQWLLANGCQSSARCLEGFVKHSARPQGSLCLAYCPGASFSKCIPSVILHFSICRVNNRNTMQTWTNQLQKRFCVYVQCT